MTMRTATSGVRVGIIGAGAWATANHLPALARRKDAVVVAVCDTDPAALARAKHRFSIPFGTTDLDELLAQDLDAVVVATPNSCHFDHALAALRTERHVLLEKPIARRAADAWRLVAEARDRGVQLLVPLGWNFWPPASEARKAIAAGELGRLELVTVHIASPMRQSVPQASGDPEATELAGYSYAQLPHALGLAFWMTGLRARRVHAEYGPPGDSPEFANAIAVRFTDGTAGVVSGAAFGRPGSYHQEIRVYGSEGFLNLDVEVDRERLRIATATRSEDHRLPKGSGAYDGTRPVHRFIDLVRGATEINESPGEVSARVIELLDAAARAHSSGHPAVIDEPPV